MPFWRKKDEGFEWNKYVRTTVLVRRKERRQKIEDVGAAAAFGVRKAKWKSVAHSKSAAKAIGRGSLAAGRAVRSGSKAGWSYSWPRIVYLLRAAGLTISQTFWTTLAKLRQAGRASWRGALYFLSDVAMPTITAVGQHISQATAPLLNRVSKPEVIGPMSFVAAIAAVGAVTTFMTSGLNQETLFITGLALSLIGLLVAAWPTGRNVFGPWPRFSWSQGSRFNLSRRTIGAALALPIMALAGATAYWQLGDGKMEWPNLPTLKMPDILPKLDVAALNPFKSEIVKGRARVIDGGHLRIAKQQLRLDNIDALLPAQTCNTRRGRSWRCGRKAKNQLNRIVRRTTLTCAISGTDEDGVKRANCLSKNGDVAAALVASGYAFAHLGAFASHRTEENQARKGKRGIWQGSAERPSDYRIARWDKAVKTAPDGCPIKGRIVRRKRFYALPWDRGYARARVSRRRGEKWFCTEQEARAAGFKHPSQI